MKEHTYINIDIQKDTRTEREKARQTDSWTDRQTGKQMDGPTDGRMAGWMDGRTDGRTAKQRDRWTENMYTDRQLCRQRYIQIVRWICS